MFWWFLALLQLGLAAALGLAALGHPAHQEPGRLCALFRGASLARLALVGLTASLVAAGDRALALPWPAAIPLGALAIRTLAVRPPSTKRLRELGTLLDAFGRRLRWEPAGVLVLLSGLAWSAPESLPAVFGAACAVLLSGLPLLGVLEWTRSRWHGGEPLPDRCRRSVFRIGAGVCLLGGPLWLLGGLADSWTVAGWAALLAVGGSPWRRPGTRFDPPEPQETVRLSPEQQLCLVLFSLPAPACERVVDNLGCKQLAASAGEVVWLPIPAPDAMARARAQLRALLHSHPEVLWWKRRREVASLAYAVPEAFARTLERCLEPVETRVRRSELSLWATGSDVAARVAGSGLIPDDALQTIFQLMSPRRAAALRRALAKPASFSESILDGFCCEVTGHLGPLDEEGPDRMARHSPAMLARALRQLYSGPAPLAPALEVPALERDRVRPSKLLLSRLPRFVRDERPALVEAED